MEKTMKFKGTMKELKEFVEMLEEALHTPDGEYKGKDIKLVDFCNGHMGGR